MVNPAGMLIAGNPVVALSWQFDPPCGCPMTAGFRRSVGYTNIVTPRRLISSSTASRVLSRFASVALYASESRDATSLARFRTVSTAG